MRISDWSSDVCSSDLKVEGVDERGGRAVVVFRSDKNECVSGIDTGAPSFCVLVLVLLQARMLWLVIKGQIEIRQINEFDIELSMRLRKAVEPLCDRRPNAPRARAANNDVKFQ